MKLTRVVAAALLLPATAVAQGVPRLDSTYMAPVTSAGKWLVYWATDEGANGEEVAGGICGKRDKGPTIKPGRTVRLFVVRGIRGSTEGFLYRYRFEQAWTDELTQKSE